MRIGANKKDRLRALKDESKKESTLVKKDVTADLASELDSTMNTVHVAFEGDNEETVEEVKRSPTNEAEVKLIDDCKNWVAV